MSAITEMTKKIKMIRLMTHNQFTSIREEESKISIMKKRVEVYKAAVATKYVSATWAKKNILGMTEKEILLGMK